MTTLPRNTRQRRAVAEILARTTEFSSAQQIHEQLRRHGQAVGLSTVYRTLQALVDSGEIDALHDGEEILYRRCEVSHHHHHLVCRHCGAAVEVEGPGAEQWAACVAEDYGYVDITHTLEIVGTCQDCDAQK